MSPLLQVKNLSVSIGKSRPVDHVDFTLEQGKILGIAGESGSGKSLTALSVMGLLPHGAKRGGTADWTGFEGNDFDLFAQNEQEMQSLRGRSISMIFQEPMTALNPLMTIGDQVAEPFLIHGQMARQDAIDAAAHLLERVGLPSDPPALKRYPHELSGGQRQRVMIAQAIALKPKLLIADEPTTALDVITQAGILDLLTRLVDEDDMAMMLITHDLAVLSNRCHDLVMMQNGRVVESGAAKAVLRQPKHPYTKSLMKASVYQPPSPIKSSPSSPLLLALREASLTYRTGNGIFDRSSSIEAVKKVSLTLHQGESLGLVGASGCGKSSLTRAILGLHPLSHGAITLDGETIIDGGKTAPPLSPAVRAKMQIVFQDPFGSFNPRHKVERLIREPLHLLGRNHPSRDDRDLAAEALIDVGLLPDDQDKYIHEFSGGQRQRIAIARALIIKPKLIILDEAVSALDVSVRGQILDLLMRLKSTHHLTYLFISHDLNVVRSVSDRVAVMDQGQIIETGETAKVLSQPKHEVTQRLIAAIPQFSTQ
ncbi:MAG: ABC transporter ATP-binding protein [Alphaproteobacteria bacterium]|nr:ABC transporter ATP-binding protein [Alphaproteobacteria bacterium]